MLIKLVMRKLKRLVGLVCGRYGDEIATWMNKEINLPVLNEKQEQRVFEEIVRKTPKLVMFILDLVVAKLKSLRK